VALEFVRPDIRPLWSAVSVTGGNIQVPGAVVSDEETGDVLKTVGFRGRVMLESADLESGQWMSHG
jgi:hypothetical protein